MDVPAGAAGAGGIKLHLLHSFGKHNVQIFQCLDKTLRVDKTCFRRIHENRIASEA
jgi:hypothetical protein